jgi:hypothetical protein
MDKTKKIKKAAADATEKLNTKSNYSYYAKSFLPSLIEDANK